MKKQISICLFLLAITAGILTWKITEIKKPEEPVLPSSEEPSDSERTAESMQIAPTVKYYLLLEDDTIFVYAADHQTLCYEISVKNRPLSAECEKQLATGLSFYSDEELYEFLENYSS